MYFTLKDIESLSETCKIYKKIIMIDVQKGLNILYFTGSKFTFVIQ